MSNVTGIVSRGDEGQITYANATMQDMAGRGILRYELPLAKIIMLVLRAYCVDAKARRITPELVNPCAVGQNGADWPPRCMVRTVCLSEFVGVMDNCAELFAARNRRWLLMFNQKTK